MVAEEGSLSEDRLLLAIAEQLKLPLLQVARQAEVGVLRGYAAGSDLIRMQTSAEAALRLVDSYMLGLRLSSEQAELKLEPVSLSAVLTDIAHQLDALARLYDVDLELHVGGKHGPVMSHVVGLQAAFLSLGHAFIESLPALRVEPHRLTLRLAAHRTPHGLVAGLYTDEPAFLVAPSHLRAARQLHGRARQPFTALSATSGAGIFVADTILQALESKLRIGRHQKLRGFAASFLPSKQLQLV